MKILLETSLDDLYILLFNENVIDKIHEKNLIKKSERLPLAVTDILTRNNLKIKDINSIYVTKGPGSFMGSRAGLLFASTIANLCNIPLWTASSLAFIRKDNEDVYWDAKGKMSYLLKGDKIKLVPKKPNYYFKYAEIESNLQVHLKPFKKVDPLLVRPLYIKEPKIG